MSLELRSVTKAFERDKADSAGMFDVSFRLAPGSFFTLLGPSGCGKTTTLRAIAGLQEPDSGYIAAGTRVYFDGDAGLSVPLDRRRIGMVFQSYAIWPHMNVTENVSFPLRMRPDGLSRASIGEKVAKALEAVQLGGFGERPASRLSGGQQQRVALARAIVAEPALLLLDEPLSNLDAALRDDMRTELKRLQQQLGITTVYVTHDQAEALEMSDLIAVMSKGRIVQMATPREIYDRPANRFVATFIGSTNLVEGVVERAIAREGSGRIRIAAGGTIDCHAPDGCRAGQSVTVSVRPEYISLDRAGAEMAGSHNRIAGNIIAASYQGSGIRYDIDAQGLRLKAYTRADQSFAIGDAVGLSFASQHAVILSN